MKIIKTIPVEIEVDNNNPLLCDRSCDFMYSFIFNYCTRYTEEGNQNQSERICNYKRCKQCIAEFGTGE